MKKALVAASATIILAAGFVGSCDGSKSADVLTLELSEAVRPYGDATAVGGSS